MATLSQTEEHGMNGHPCIILYAFFCGFLHASVVMYLYIWVQLLLFSNVSHLPWGKSCGIIPLFTSHV